MSQIVSKTVQLPVSEERIAGMFNRIAPRYDLLNTLLSMRQDRRWRKALVASIPYRPDGHLLDVATGTGDVLVAAARAHPEYAHYEGVDIAENMLALARRKCAAFAFTEKMSFRVVSAERLENADQSLDCVTIAFGLRNVVDRPQALREFFRVLRPEGKALILEFFLPKGGAVAALFQFYFHYVLPKIGGLLSDRSAYTYLPQSVAGFYSRSELCDKMRECGFAQVRVRSFMWGACCLVEGRKL